MSQSGIQMVTEKFIGSERGEKEKEKENKKRLHLQKPPICQVYFLSFADELS